MGQRGQHSRAGPAAASLTVRGPVPAMAMPERASAALRRTADALVAAVLGARMRRLPPSPGTSARRPRLLRVLADGEPALPSTLPPVWRHAAIVAHD